MDIQTTLTLVIAAVILGAAALLGFVVTNLARVGRVVWRMTADRSGRPRVEDALPRMPAHQRFRDGLRTVAAIVAASLARSWRSLVRAARGVSTFAAPVSPSTKRTDGDT